MPTGPSSGGGATSGAVRAGGAFVELFAKDNLSKTLDKVQARMAAFGSALSRAGGRALLGGLALGAPLAGLFSGTVGLAKQGVFGQGTQATAQAFTDAWMKAIVALQKAMIPILEIITPALEQLADLVAKNKDVVLVIAGVAAGLVVLGVSLKVLALVGPIAAAGVAAFQLALAALGAPLLIVVGLVVAFAASVVDWGGLLGKIGDTGKAAFGGIVEALKKGDLQLAWKIALAGLKLAWFDLVEWMRESLFKIREALAGADKNDLVGIGAGAFKAAKVASPLWALGPAGWAAWGASTVLGAGLGGLAEEGVKQAVKPGGVFQPDQAGRGQAQQELNNLLKRAAALPDIVRPLRDMINEARGTFGSSALQQALGYGASVNEQTEAAKAAVRLLGSIDDKIGRLNGLVYG
jgi:hypothetical protein